MTSRQIASLLIKVAACYVLIQTIPDILSVAATAGASGEFNMSHPLVPSIILSVIGLPLLMFLIINRSERLASFMVKDDVSPISLVSLTPDDIRTFAFALVGLVVLVQGITGLVYQLAYLRQLTSQVGNDLPRVSFERQIYSGLASSIVALVIGAVLFVSPRGLSHLWTSLQRTRPMKES